MFSLTPSYAKLPPFAQDYLKKIPGQKLSLPYVVGTALDNAEVYKDIGYEYAKADLEYEATESREDWMLYGGANYLDDSTIKTSPFQPLRTQYWDWNLGVSKSFASGTKISTGWKHSFTELEFSPAVLGFGGGFLNNYKETRVTVGLEQSLLKDFFGYNYRKKLAASKDRGEAIKSSAQKRIEDTTMGFIQLFYKAWLKQQRVFSVRNQLKRQQKLLKVTTRKKNRGVVEAPEFLQIQALVDSKGSELEIAKAELAEEWENLVINLKLPDEFLNINPIDVPTVLDDPMPASIRICQQSKPQTTTDIRRLESIIKALESELSASKNNSLPDLKLIAGYEGNGIDGGGRPELNNQIFDGRGPSWNVGLVLNWPLSNSANKADVKKKWLEKAQSEAGLRSSKDMLKANWSSLCRALRVNRNNEKIYKSILKKQNQRVEAENKRFALGRIPMDQLVNAENDLGTWEYVSQQQSITTRTIAWNVQNLAGELYNQISKQVEKRRQEAP